MRAIQKGKNIFLFILIFAIIGWLTANPLFFAIGAVLAFILIFDLVIFLFALDGMEVSISKKISTNKMFINNYLEVDNELKIKVKYLKNISFHDAVPDAFKVISSDPFAIIDPVRPQHNITYGLQAIKKGHYSFKGSYLDLKSNFHLFDHRIILENKADVSIYPPVLSRRAVVAQYTSSLYGTGKSNKKGMGTEFANIRDYTPGDDYRHIDWKTSLRLNNLFIKEFESDQEMPFFVLIDQTRTSDSGTSLDYAIKVANHMTQMAANNNQKVGLITYKQDSVINQNLIKKGKKRYELSKELISLEPLESKTYTSSMDIMELKILAKKLKSFNSEKFYSMLQPFYADNPEHLKLLEKHGVYQAIQKVITFSRNPSLITIITDIINEAPLIESIRLATYYGHRVILIVTSHILFRKYDVLELEEHYQEYLDLQKKIDKFRKLKGVKVFNAGHGDKVELLMNQAGYRWKTFQ
ncbi:MAG: DUF58 domain-containing protein [Euryarchaeota archaeon]|nr:DUF58 domain-containing protein [Euryarchaeota archaeon]MCG2738042.1 DUF58 domain-containing protein [Candidatus Methanoperedenaceae archaeon]